MIELVEKRVKKIRLSDITLEVLCKFYEDEYNRNTILLIFDNDNYYTNIAYEEIVRFCDQKEFIYFLGFLCKEKSVNEGQRALKDAEKIFKNNSNIYYVLVKKEESSGSGSEMFYTNVIWLEELYKENLINLKHLLRRKGVLLSFRKIMI